MSGLLLSLFSVWLVAYPAGVFVVACVRGLDSSEALDCALTYLSGVAILGLLCFLVSLNP